MPNFWRSGAPRILKIQWFPLSILIFGPKSCFLGPTIFKIPQPNWYKYVLIHNLLLYHQIFSWTKNCYHLIYFYWTDFNKWYIYLKQAILRSWENHLLLFESHYWVRHIDLTLNCCKHFHCTSIPNDKFSISTDQSEFVLPQAQIFQTVPKKQRAQGIKRIKNSTFWSMLTTIANKIFMSWVYKLDNNKSDVVKIMPKNR